MGRGAWLLALKKSIKQRDRCFLGGGRNSFENSRGNRNLNDSGKVSKQNKRVRTCCGGEQMLGSAERLGNAASGKTLREVSCWQIWESVALGGLQWGVVHKETVVFWVAGETVPKK